MNISSLPIPKTFEEIIKTYEDYYQKFYLEMIRMSNSNFNTYLDNYIKLIENLIKSSLYIKNTENLIRAAIGILSLHVFGYDDFDRLIHLYDRILPQTELEYVKFTSWCAGTLIHHPEIKQSRYVKHLFTERIYGWALSRGRRARHLAAAYLIDYLSISAGSTVVVFFPTLQSIIWLLVSHHSKKVLRATADAVFHFVNAILQYARNDFNEIMIFFIKLASKLISFGDSLHIYMGLLLYERLITISPDFFMTRTLPLCGDINIFIEDKSECVSIASYQTICAFSRVDASTFENTFFDEIINKTGEMLNLYPKEVVQSLCLLIKTVPQLLRPIISQLLQFCEQLVSHGHSPFLLLSKIFKKFKKAAIAELQLNQHFLIDLIDYPELNQDYFKFIINACKIFLKSKTDLENKEIERMNKAAVVHQSKSIFHIGSFIPSSRSLASPLYLIPSSSIDNMVSLTDDKSPEAHLPELSYASFMELHQLFIQTLSAKLKMESESHSNEIEIDSATSSNSLLTLKILAEIPPDILCDDVLPDIMNALESLSSSPDVIIREYVPKAIYNLGKQKPELISKEELIEKIFHIALFDNFSPIRASALTVINDNINDPIFASPQHMKSMQIFVNDDAITVRKIALAILGKLVNYNPIGVAAITKHCLLDTFSIIRHVPGIRKRSRAARILSDIIRASAKTITIYSGGFMEIAIDIFTEHQKKVAKGSNSFSNFIEVTAYTQLLISIVDALTLLAPLDPSEVSKHSDFLIEFLCSLLNPDTNRNLILSVLELLYVLLKPPASTRYYRAKAPIILLSCSSLLSITESSKERIALLKVIGAIGVLEIHQKSIVVASSPPPSYEESLTRQFYHPSRDDDRTCDESWLIQDDLQDSYINVYTTSCVIDIFNDDTLKEFHVESVQSLVSIFANLDHDNLSAFQQSNQDSKLMSNSVLHQFDLFVTRFIEVMKNMPKTNHSAYVHEMQNYLPLFAVLVHNSRSNINPFIKDAIELIKDQFCSELAQEFVEVILSFIQETKDAFSGYASETICLLIGCLDSSKTADANLSKTVLKAFSSLGIYASDLLYLIVPQICDAIECEQTLPKVRVIAFQTLSILMQSVDLFPYLGLIMRSLTTGLFSTDIKTQRSAFDFLNITLKAQGSNFLKDAEPIFEQVNSLGIMTTELQSVIEDVKNGKYQKTYKPLLFSFNEMLKNSSNDDKRSKPKRVRRDSTSSQYFIMMQQLTHTIGFSETAIISKAMTPNLGREKHLEQWLFSFVVNVISNSPSASIRACTSLATNYPSFAYQLFCIAFFSCWKLMSEEGKGQITKSFSDLLSASGTYDTVIREIIKLLVFMDKVEMPIDIDLNIVVNACIRYGGTAYALHLVTQKFEDKPDDFELLSMIIDLYTKLGSWPNATGLWSKAKMKYASFNNAEMLSKLRMWDQVEPLYRGKIARSRELDFDSFMGLTQSLAALAKWEDIMKLYDKFQHLKPHEKSKVASYFAEAAIKLGNWNDLNLILYSSPEDSFTCKALMALNAIHNNEMNRADNYIEDGFSLLSSKPVAFLADNQLVVQNELMLQCQELVEISEMKMWILNEHRTDVEEVWNERLKTAPRDFDLWFWLLSSRACVTQINDSNLIRFFSMKSVTLGTKLLTNAFDSLFPYFDYQTAPDILKACYIVAHWNTGEKSRALEEMPKLISTLENGDLLIECRYIYANWIIDRSDNNPYDSVNNLESLKIAFNNLKEIIVSHYKSIITQHLSEEEPTSNQYSPKHTTSTTVSDKTMMNNEIIKNKLLPDRLRRLPRKASTNLSFTPIRHRHTSDSVFSHEYVLPSQIFRELLTSNTFASVEVVRKWADVNVQLSAIDKGNLSMYITNAIDGLTNCASIYPNFPDVVLLLNLFFENAEKSDVFTTAHNCIERLPPKLLLQASPQLLVQLSHSSQIVSDFVNLVVTNLLNDHYHELIFSVIVLTKSSNLTRAEAAKRLIEQFTSTHPAEYLEVHLIRKCLLKAAVTWGEGMITMISEALDFFQHTKIKKMREKLENITFLLRPEKAKCAMNREFLKHHNDEIQQLAKLLENFPSIPEIIERQKGTENQNISAFDANDSKKEIARSPSSTNSNNDSLNNGPDSSPYASSQSSNPESLGIPTSQNINKQNQIPPNQCSPIHSNENNANQYPQSTNQYDYMQANRSTQSYFIHNDQVQSNQTKQLAIDQIPENDYSQMYSSQYGYMQSNQYPHMYSSQFREQGTLDSQNRDTYQSNNYQRSQYPSNLNHGHGYGIPNYHRDSQEFPYNRQFGESYQQHSTSPGQDLDRSQHSSSEQHQTTSVFSDSNRDIYQQQKNSSPKYEMNKTQPHETGYKPYAPPPNGLNQSERNLPQGGYNSGYQSTGPYNYEYEYQQRLQMSQQKNHPNERNPYYQPNERNPYYQPNRGLGPNQMNNFGVQRPPFNPQQENRNYTNDGYQSILPNQSHNQDNESNNQASSQSTNQPFSQSHGQQYGGYQPYNGYSQFSRSQSSSSNNQPSGGYQQSNNPSNHGYSQSNGQQFGGYQPPNGQQFGGYQQYGWHQQSNGYSQSNSTRNSQPNDQQNDAVQQPNNQQSVGNIYSNDHSTALHSQSSNHAQGHELPAEKTQKETAINKPKSIEKVESSITENDSIENKAMDDIVKWCTRNQTILNDELKNIKTIQMSAISPVLCEKNDFHLAVFGTYKPNKPINRIKYFVGQFSVYMSKQQPKDVVVKGEDGTFYQYLLKGHEDLRLDERIMQFFRLINSLINKETCFNGNLIQTISVIPLSSSHGLVQWVPGTETLRNIVEDYRTLHHVDPTIEYELANEMSVINFDYLQPIRKMQIIEEIFKEVPDTDIANSFWLKSSSAELWFKKSNTFAISNAITSIVGYVIGLGDRHPSNLLIDRDTGKVVHIDFGDCFERAMTRQLLPEVVPFRLTRMIVRAFGAAGYDGLYRSSFINMSNILRANSRVLVMVLAVFVHEPLSAPDDARTSINSSETPSDTTNLIANSNGDSNENDENMKRVVSSEEMRKKVMQKLTGNDFGEKKMSVENQATLLIQMATDTYNLSKMYSGWCPFW